MLRFRAGLSIGRLAAGLALGLGIGLGASRAAAQGDCQWYATQALRQQELNQQLGCKLVGDAWHKDLKQHYSWCITVSPDVWKKAAQTREQELAQCRTKLGK